MIGMRLVAMVKFITGDLLKSIRTVISRGVDSFNPFFYCVKKSSAWADKASALGSEQFVTSKTNLSFAYGSPKRKLNQRKGAKGQGQKLPLTPMREEPFS